MVLLCKAFDYPPGFLYSLLFDDNKLNKQTLEKIKLVFFSLSLQGLFDLEGNINWFYSYQLSTQLPILSNVIFDNQYCNISS